MMFHLPRQPRRRLLTLMAGTALAPLAAAMPAAAQTVATAPLPTENAPPNATEAGQKATPAPNAAATEADGGIADIVVTAQKRSQNAQDVPIAITALDSGQLRAAGVASTADLKATVPALNVTTATGGYGLPRIRGVGATGQGPGIENPVAVYVDGVYYGAAFGVLQSLFDIDQVAVLKGPQGTLFGRNATGGLIQITTLGPSFQPSARAEFGYGNLDTVHAAGYLSAGLSQTLAFSLSGQYENEANGYGRNVYTGSPIQAYESAAIRGKLLWKPSDATSFLLSADANRRNGSEPAFRNFGLNSLGQNVPAQIVAAGGNPDRDIYSDLDPQLHARQWGTSLTASQDLGGVALKSITAYRKTDLSILFDPDGTTAPRTIIANTQFDKQLTEEVNLVSNGHHRVDYVIGAFYMNDAAGLSPARTTGLLVNGNNGYADYRSDIRLNSYAGFAEGTFQIDAATNATAGIRYTSDHRTATAASINYVGATNTTTTVPTSGDVTFNKLTWRLSLDHRWSPELLTYASYNRGFRSGSFVPQTNPLQVLNPEQTDAYEIGLKSDLFDRRVRFNLAAYYYDQKNLQVIQIIAGTQYVYNAQGAHIYGLDGDVTFKLTRDIRLFGGFNYVHGRYTSFTNAILSQPYPFTPAQFILPAGQSCIGTFGNPYAQLGGNCLYRGDASGKRLQNTPTFTGSVGGSWDIPAASAGRFTLTGNYYYNSGFVATPDERVTQPHYNTVDASLTWHVPGDRVYVRAWGKNLTDAFYRTQLSASNTGDNGTNAAPRTYGISAGFDF